MARSFLIVIVASLIGCAMETPPQEGPTCNVRVGKYSRTDELTLGTGGCTTDFVPQVVVVDEPEFEPLRLNCANETNTDPNPDSGYCIATAVGDCEIGHVTQTITRRSEERIESTYTLSRSDGLLCSYRTTLVWIEEL